FNPDGVSVALTAEKYETLVTGSKKPWFIKFYAPWCHHCQALAPTWAQLGKEMKDKLNIGEVNCDVEAKLCKEVGVRAFPTLLFIKGTERAEYEGLRGLGDLKSYGEGAAAAAVGVVDVDAAALEALEQKEEVVFVYFYDHATTSEDFASLEKMPVNLVGRARIVKTQDPKLAERYKITTFPRLLRDHLDIANRQTDEETRHTAFPENEGRRLAYAHAVAVADGAADLHPPADDLQRVRRSLRDETSDAAGKKLCP
ncbi:hypothetical protein BN1708_016291, partial [Verticillium longisporum]